MTITTVDKNMSAVAFADSGEHDTTRRSRGENTKKQAGKFPAPAAKSKPYLKTIIFGTMSLSAYYMLFTNEKLVTQVFTAGGWHWVYPVGAAFFFSFIHGAFASNLLSSIGLEAKK